MTDLRITAGFLPLLDSLLLVIAREKGLRRSAGHRPRAGARNLVGQYPRPRRGRAFRRRPHAGADADRRQSRAVADRRADRRADDAGARRQRHHRQHRPLAAHARRRRARQYRSPGRLAQRLRAVVAGGGAAAALCRYPSAFGPQLRAALLARGQRHRTRIATSISSSCRRR